MTARHHHGPALHRLARRIPALYRNPAIRKQPVSSADYVLAHLQLVQEGLGFALLPDSVGALLPPGVTLKPLAYEPMPTVSIVVAWKTGNVSPLVRAFVDLVRQSLSLRKDAARLTGRSRKS